MCGCVCIYLHVVYKAWTKLVVSCLHICICSAFLITCECCNHCLLWTISSIYAFVWKAIYILLTSHTYFLICAYVLECVSEGGVSIEMGLINLKRISDYLLVLCYVLSQSPWNKVMLTVLPVEWQDKITYLIKRRWMPCHLLYLHPVSAASLTGEAGQCWY